MHAGLLNREKQRKQRKKEEKEGHFQQQMYNVTHSHYFVVRKKKLEIQISYPVAKVLFVLVSFIGFKSV